MNTIRPSLLPRFDSADGFSTCTRRLRSNSPLQLLNDEAFHEFAQALAARILKDGPKSDPARIDHAFRLCLSRPPARTEIQRLRSLLQTELTRPNADGPTKQIAVWTAVARVLLNLDETITRE